MYVISYPNIIEIEDETLLDITPLQPGGDDVVMAYAATTVDGKNIKFSDAPFRSRSKAEACLKDVIEFRNDPRYRCHKLIAFCPICGQRILDGDGFVDAGGFVYRHEWC
jgi:hypothetical protein